MISIQLNSFVHRVSNKTSFSDLASQHGCQLKRIRRSRHWLLSGSEQQLVQLSSAIWELKDEWVKVAISKALPVTQRSVEDILSTTPGITLNQLIEESGCTVVEARKAIDRFEQLD